MVDVLLGFLIELAVRYFWDRVLGFPFPSRFWDRS